METTKFNSQDPKIPDTSSLPNIEASIGDQVAFLRSILEGSTEYSIVAKDLSGTILAWNEGARRIYGYQPQMKSLAKVRFFCTSLLM